MRYIVNLHQLNSVRQHVRSQFYGVYAADEFPYYLPPQTLAIVNCCNVNQKGMHWLAINTSEDISFSIVLDMHPTCMD